MTSKEAAVTHSQDAGGRVFGLLWVFLAWTKFIFLFKYDYGMVMFLSCSILILEDPCVMLACCEMVCVQQENTKVQL